MGVQSFGCAIQINIYINMAIYIYIYMVTPPRAYLSTFCMKEIYLRMYIYMKMCKSSWDSCGHGTALAVQVLPAGFEKPPNCDGPARGLVPLLHALACAYVCMSVCMCIYIYTNT